MSEHLERLFATVKAAELEPWPNKPARLFISEADVRAIADEMYEPPDPQLDVYLPGVNDERRKRREEGLALVETAITNAKTGDGYVGTLLGIPAFLRDGLLEVVL